VGVNGTWTKAEITPDPLYDPHHDRVRRLPRV
jgi:hypothetical protein